MTNKEILKELDRMTKMVNKIKLELGEKTIDGSDYDQLMEYTDNVTLYLNKSYGYFDACTRYKK